MAFKMKGFEPHSMYKTEQANTKAQHDALEKKGYDHNPYKKKSPLYKKTRCWKGYEPTPGKKPYSKGSCKKK